MLQYSTHIVFLVTGGIQLGTPRFPLSDPWKLDRDQERNTTDALARHVPAKLPMPRHAIHVPSLVYIQHPVYNTMHIYMAS